MVTDRIQSNINTFGFVFAVKAEKARFMRMGRSPIVAAKMAHITVSAVYALGL